MRKFVIAALAGALGLTGAAETIQPAAAAETQVAPRSLEQARQSALAELAAGELQLVRHQRWRGGRSYHGRRHYRARRWGPRRYYGGRRYYGRRYYGARPYHGRRHRPGFYIGIRP